MLEKLIDSIVNTGIKDDNYKYNVELRHLYKDKKFKFIRSLLEMKSLFPKNMNKTSDKYANRYREYYIWLCYRITKPYVCEICGKTPCKKGLYLKKLGNNETVLRICRGCAIKHYNDYHTDFLETYEKEEIRETCNKCNETDCEVKAFISKTYPNTKKKKKRRGKRR